MSELEKERKLTNARSEYQKKEKTPATRDTKHNLKLCGDGSVAAPQPSPGPAARQSA